MSGQNVQPQSTPQVNGKQGSSYGMWGGIISAIHDGVFDWANMSYNRKMAQKQIDMQYDFAKNGISWRVADAKRAGLHPLYALGANTPTYTPMDISGGEFPRGTATRAFNSALAGQQMDIAMEREQLQNDLLKAQVQALETQTLGNISQIDQNTTSAIPSGFTKAGEYDIRNEFGMDKKDLLQPVLERTSEPKTLFDMAYLHSAEKADRASGKLSPNMEYDAIKFMRYGKLIPVPRGQTEWKQGSSIGDWAETYIFNPIAREYRKLRNKYR